MTEETRASAARVLLDRALAAEERAEELEAQVGRLKALVGGALDMDPTSAVQALNWVGRAQAAEELLAQALRWRDQGGDRDVFENLPPSWWATVEATVKAAELSKQDEPENAERPADDAYWATGVGSEGVPRALKPGVRPEVARAAVRALNRRTVRSGPLG